MKLYILFILNIALIVGCGEKDQKNANSPSPKTNGEVQVDNSEKLVLEDQVIENGCNFKAIKDNASLSCDESNESLGFYKRIKALIDYKVKADLLLNKPLKTNAFTLFILNQKSEQVVAYFLEKNISINYILSNLAGLKLRLRDAYLVKLLQYYDNTLVMSDKDLELFESQIEDLGGFNAETLIDLQDSRKKLIGNLTTTSWNLLGIIATDCKLTLDILKKDNLFTITGKQPDRTTTLCVQQYSKLFLNTVKQFSTSKLEYKQPSNFTLAVYNYLFELLKGLSI